jgi:hypothetical protein
MLSALMRPTKSYALMAHCLSLPSALEIEAEAACVANHVLSFAQDTGACLCEYVGDCNAKSADGIPVATEERQGLYRGFMNLTNACMTDGYRVVQGETGEEQCDVYEYA